MHRIDHDAFARDIDPAHTGSLDATGDAFNRHIDPLQDQYAAALAALHSRPEAPDEALTLTAGMVEAYVDAAQQLLASPPATSAEHEAAIGYLVCRNGLAAHLATCDAFTAATTGRAGQLWEQLRISVADVTSCYQGLLVALGHLSADGTMTSASAAARPQPGGVQLLVEGGEYPVEAGESAAGSEDHETTAGEDN